jgi:glycolate oxidase
LILSGDYLCFSNFAVIVAQVASFGIMEYKKISTEDIAYFVSVLGAGFVLQNEEERLLRASDHTEDLVYMPEVVLLPYHPKEVSAILAYCNTNIIPVTARGAGTGLSGGALPVFGGVVLDMSRFNKILNIDTLNFQVTVEPGVITQVLQEAVAEQGLFYPVDPASKGSCFIGGNVAENSGGPRAVKYGTVKDYVLNLEVVLASGEIIWTGANVLKNATGYNLTQLIVGSEGTLGIVTKIVLRLLPAVKHNLTLLVPFREAADACKAVNAIMLQGFIPSALEFMERDALEWSMKYVQGNSVQIQEDIKAHLLIELDGNGMDEMYRDAEAISEICGRFDIDEVMMADTHAQKQMLWNLRRKVGEAVKSNSIYKEEDTVVPRACLPELLKVVKDTGMKYGFKSVCYGHAGDGNLHVNIVKGELTDEVWRNMLPNAIREIFTEVVKMGGTLSGEHGIGWVQKEYMDIAFSATQLQLMQLIKHVFDPNEILNPGKIFKK